MYDVVEILLLLPGVVILFFAGYDAFFLGASLFARARRPNQSSTTPARAPSSFGIIVPAHDEELVISALLASIARLDYPPDKFDVFVIADNCSDSTAQLVRDSGVTCLERVDPDNRGKPFALHWAISTVLDIDSHDAWVIVDADTVLDSQFLSVMNSELLSGSDIIQGYFGVMNPRDNWLTRLSVLPAALKFKLHHPGKRLLGLSVPLAGNGMCFRKEVFLRFGWSAFSLAENWEYYIMAILNGYRIVANERAVIHSQVTRTLSTGRAQRVRWLRGRLQTLHRYGHRLLFDGDRCGLAQRIDAFVELAKPSHSMLLVWTVLLAAAGTVAWATSGRQVWPLAFAGAALVLQLIYLGAGLIVERVPPKTWLALAMVPFYLVWKTAITVSGLLAPRSREWMKTARHAVDEEDGR